MWEVGISDVPSVCSCKPICPSVPIDCIAGLMRQKDPQGYEETINSETVFGQFVFLAVYNSRAKTERPTHFSSVLRHRRSLCLCFSSFGMRLASRPHAWLPSPHLVVGLLLLLLHHYQLEVSAVISMSGDTLLRQYHRRRCTFQLRGVPRLFEAA